MRLGRRSASANRERTIQLLPARYRRSSNARAFWLLSLGIASFLLVFGWLLFAPGSPACILPKPPTARVAKRPYAIPFPAVPNASSPEQALPSYESSAPSRIPRTGHRLYYAQLIIRNACGTAVTGSAGTHAFRLRLGESISLNVEAGWLNVRAEAPGMRSRTTRVMVLPYGTYECRLELEGG